ncbi:Fumarate reductase subunit D [Caenispirillum salinarum AK4]|uniref:Fumarate reductase subunit D n=1 Tax=Caenispirillum salinarum AK4 TaxID=1238182 RepID=K9H1C2_9PROT|nr:fumarate reductase subunit FrdD [Caenispirillum salinarum]EKV30864.1 Fumarate reductase subunit D [Caenispirillum salinarum AK4]
MMHRSKSKPIFWGLFAAGGTVSAFLAPVMILIAGILVPLGIMTDALSYDSMHALADNWIGKIILFGVLTLFLWHFGHRMRVTLHDLGIHNKGLAVVVCYGVAGIGTLWALVTLLSI